jgi:hypothetical protein
MVQALLRCHQENPKMKFLGACNNAKAAMDICFKVRCSQLSPSLFLRILRSPVSRHPPPRPNALCRPRPPLALLVLLAPPARLYTRRAR